MKLKVRYKGQALAIVLIVLVVAIIIGMAIMSRVVSDQLQVRNERLSINSLEYADTVLDGLRKLSYSDLAEFAEANQGICNPTGDPTYDFSEDGCTFDQLSELNVLSNYFAGKGLDDYFTTLYGDLENNCRSLESNGESSIKIVVSTLEDEEDIEINKDSVFSLRLNGQAPTAPGCGVDVSLSPLGNLVSGAVLYSTYVEGLNSPSLKPFELGDSSGYCLKLTSCSGLGWNNWSNWLPASSSANGYYTLPTVPIVKSYKSTNFYLNELRVKAVASDMAVRTSFTTANCVEPNRYLKVSTVVNCSGNSRGKEITLSSESWAPQIFDYVIFNGDGKLVQQ